MLPKKQRLSRHDFLIAKSHGQTIRTPHFSAIVYKTGGVIRVAVVTSSKLHKHAVVRNRLRRRIYSRLNARRYPLDADIIIFPHRPMLNLSREEIGAELNSFLSKISEPGHRNF